MSINPIFIPTPRGAGFVMPSAGRVQGGHLVTAAVRGRTAGFTGADLAAEASAKRTQGTQVWSPPT